MTAQTPEIKYPYHYADGIIDVANEEVGGAVATGVKAFINGKITEEQQMKLSDLAMEDYNKIGDIPYAELEALIQKYTEFDRTKIYIYPGFTVSLEMDIEKAIDYYLSMPDAELIEAMAEIMSNYSNGEYLH